MCKSNLGLALGVLIQRYNSMLRGDHSIAAQANYEQIFTLFQRANLRVP